LIEAMPLLDQTLLLVVDVTNPAAVDAFLQHATDLVVNRVLPQYFNQYSILFRENHFVLLIVLLQVTP
jgi:hypothetical protein